MAIMINCAMDWSFDLFASDCEKYKALPIKGVHCRRGASYEEVFVSTIKLICNDWIAKNAHKFPYKWKMGAELWDYLLNDIFFSDWYKDVYGQRPHLTKNFYLYVLGYEEYIDTLGWGCLGGFYKFTDDVTKHRKDAKKLRLAYEEAI